MQHARSLSSPRLLVAWCYSQCGATRASGLLGSLGGRAPGHAAATPGCSTPLRRARELVFGSTSVAPCLRAAASAGDVLLAEGWVERSEWDSLLCGAQPAPSQPEPSEPGV